MIPAPGAAFREIDSADVAGDALFVLMRMSHGSFVGTSVPIAELIRRGHTPVEAWARRRSAWGPDCNETSNGPRNPFPSRESRTAGRRAAHFQLAFSGRKGRTTSSARCPTPALSALRGKQSSYEYLKRCPCEE